MRAYFKTEIPLPDDLTRDTVRIHAARLIAEVHNELIDALREELTRQRLTKKANHESVIPVIDNEDHDEL